MRSYLGMNMTIKLTAILAIVLGIPAHEASAAHILEPLGTEIAATAPRGRIFGQIVYDYAKFENGTTLKTHLLPVEFEAGIGERSQLNLEGVVVLREEVGTAREHGVDELAFGLKHRFLDEGPTAPDAAFEVEYVPSAGLTGNGHALAGTLILSKNLGPRVVLHLNGGYELETERELAVELGTPSDPDAVAAVTEEVHNQATWIYSVAPMFKVIPDKLILLAELNGRTHASGDTELVLVPEIIAVVQNETVFALQNVAFKFAVLFGLNDDSPDVGFKFGISKLF
ncbi:MAG: hypothetical protein ABIO65_13440 [Nitrospiria bacterium]